MIFIIMVKIIFTWRLLTWIEKYFKRCMLVIIQLFPLYLDIAKILLYRCSTPWNFCITCIKFYSFIDKKIKTFNSTCHLKAFLMFRNACNFHVPPIPKTFLWKNVYQVQIFTLKVVSNNKFFITFWNHPFSYLHRNLIW